MGEFVSQLFGPIGFEASPNRGWSTELAWLHTTADILIWLAFLAIPAMLFYFVHRRKRAPFPFIFWMFGAFIVSSGFTHFMEVATLWAPLSHWSALIKVLTAVLSWATVVALIPLLPRALALRGPEELEREIAERRRVEEKLREGQEALAKHAAELTRSEEAYRYQSKVLRSILDSIGDAVIVADHKGKFILLNAAAEQVLGKGPAEAVTDTWTQRSGLYLPNRTTPYPLGELPLMRAVRGESVDGVEIFVRHAKVRQGMWVSASARPLLDDQGNRQGGVAVFRNITAQKLADERIRQSEERFRLLVEGVKEYAIFLLAPDGRVVSWNSGAERIKGYCSEDILGQHFSCFYPPEEVAAGRPERELCEALACGRVENEGWRVRKDGSRFWADSVIRAIYDPGGQVLGFAQVTRDITDRKQAEEKLKTFSARLEQSNRELESFASVASHDLQEPLRKIQAFGGRLEAKCAGQLDAQGLDYLARIQNAAGRMRTLIDDLLAFSRVTTKAQPFMPVDLNQLAREVVNDLEERIRITSGRVEIDPLPTIEADPAQMRRLLQNLISNALKFHRQDEPPVVRVEGQVVPSLANGHPAGGPSCQLRVADNGIGFDEKYLGRLFQVFARLHGRDEYEGTGMGLAICRKIAERHGGGISARSAPGQGATFTVTLPIRQPSGKE